MGFRKGGYKRKQKGNTKAKQEDSRDAQVFDSIIKENEDFKNYYKSQNILSDEEFEKFYTALQTPLPSDFRITGSRNHALEIREIVENVYGSKLQNITVDGVEYAPLRPLPWYPDRLAWTLEVPRPILRNSPEFREFQRFIVGENASGNLSRQEAVSMIPPLLMDIQPHQHVLDMCAAPGSKTGQILEAIHANDRINELPRGLVVANDADYRRSHTLVHQLKRLQSPCFMATNHDATQFPNIHIGDDTSTSAWLFDRVLCDVPCSGDGTMRKNQRIWTTWKNQDALSLHNVQVQIFFRGAQLAKVGGRIVYSTCSINPIENEAVVAEVLRQTNGAIQLKDMSDALPLLKRKPGLKTWKVMTRDGQYIKSAEEIENKRHRADFPKSVFPPENPDELHLERCLRIYPHEQNTGGFFVAVFEKTKPVITTHSKPSQTAIQPVNLLRNADLKLAEDEKTTATAQESDDVPSKRPADALDESKPKKQRKDVPSMNEAPFNIMLESNPDVPEISDFYGLAPEFPRNQFLLRSDVESKNRKIYFISSAVKAVLQAKDIHRLHIVNSGLRLFERQTAIAEGGSPFRLTSEGVPFIEPSISDRRVVLASPADLQTILVDSPPRLDSLDPATKSKMLSIGSGCCILRVDMSEATMHTPRPLGPIMLPLWAGKSTINVLVNKQEKRSLCLRLFNIDPLKSKAESEPVDDPNVENEEEAVM